ncbi:hypothetical protein FIM04_01475 [SAR202 cluster bacterium AC-409-J13_OGT_754m]|nr:hypothetical protein [SAR202 cluster bacterium AC-409-J13_OGT_754m]
MNRNILILSVLMCLAIVSSSCGGDDSSSANNESTARVKLEEYSLSFLDRGSSNSPAKAGTIAFQVENKGLLNHDFIVVKTNLTADSLEVNSFEAKVNEQTVGEILGRIPQENLGPSSTYSLSLNMSPGKYVIFCNVAAHYQSGMYGQFYVE